MAKKDRLIQWLRDAHAMEMQAETMLSRQAERIENYPALKARIEQHIQETQRQAELVEGCLQRLGADVSSTKDIAGSGTAMMQAMGGVFTGDEVVKGAMAGYTFEHFEIASYRALIAAAAEVGDRDTQRVCEEILKQEEEMGSWLAAHLPEVTQEYLRREATGARAKT